MATVNSTVVALHPVKAKTPAERAAAYRLRKKSRDNVETPPPVSVPKPVTPVTPSPSRPRPVTPSPLSPRDFTVTAVAKALLVVTSFGLAGVAIAMNGWFAHSLGSSEVAAWCFCAIGVAADATALALPACATALWQTRQRGAALAGWLVWSFTFAFTVTAGIGFASVNVADVTTSRAARVTPAIEMAKVQLADAMSSRDRECASGAGKNCRNREDAVAERRKVLDGAVSAIEQSADPQTQAASRIVSWLTGGMAKPSADDVAMLRLILLALLPQLGGVLLMIGRK